MAGDGKGEAERLWAVIGGLTGIMVTGYFLVPIDAFGSERPEVSWASFLVVLTMIAVLLLKQMRDVLLDRPGARPAVVTPVLMCLSLMVFSVAYYTVASDQGEFHGLHTRMDALYFTVVTLATVGYGDIDPLGQTARLLVLVQIVYNLVFLTAAATILARRLRSHLSRHRG